MDVGASVLAGIVVPKNVFSSGECSLLVCGLDHLVGSLVIGLITDSNGATNVDGTRTEGVLTKFA
jgi:hypothetical protein